MKGKRIVARLLKRIAKKNVDSACCSTFYQPKVPKALKKD